MESGIGGSSHAWPGLGNLWLDHLLTFYRSKATVFGQSFSFRLTSCYHGIIDPFVNLALACTALGFP